MTRVVVSDPETGDSYQVETDGDVYLGRSIGEEVSGSVLGLDGYTLEITGGSDDTGRPMRGDVDGPDIEEVLVSGGTGFNPSRDGERKRISVRGSEISEKIVQLNAKVVEKGDSDIESLLGESEESGDE